MSTDDCKVALLEELPAPPEVHLTHDKVLPHKEKYLKRIDRLTEKLQLGADDGEFNVKGWARGKDGGLTCVDFAQLESQKGVMLHLVKSFGSNLMSGKSVVNVSLPVRIFEPRSFLQRIPDAWCYAPVFLTKAAFADTPLERFHYVITFMVSGLHKAVTNTKPFNPILGETFQGCFKDGSQIFLEQTSHHPPISSFELVGPNRVYHVHGSHEFAASLRANSIQGSQIGLTHVDFLDGTRISYHLPYALVRGTVIGDRNFTWMGTCRFTDEKNGLSCDVIFNPDEKNGFTKLFSAQKTPDDHIRGEIFYTGPLDVEVVNPRLAGLRNSSSVTSHASNASSSSSSSSSDMEKKRKEELKKLKKDQERRAEQLNSNSTPPTNTTKDNKDKDKDNSKANPDAKEQLPTLVSIVQGSWMDGLHFGPPGGQMEPLWTKGTIAPFKTILHENPLPSDCRFREDLIHLIRGNLDEAQKWKSELEERQRAEKNLRKTHEKTVKKRMESIMKRSTSSHNIKK